MTSCELIPAKIKQNKPQEQVALRENIFFSPNVDDNFLKFTDTLISIGGSIVEATNYAAIEKNLTEKFKDAKIIISIVEEINIGNTRLENISDPHNLSLVDLTVLRGAFGVAENGAIWLDETNIGAHRVLPFITQHLVIILDKKT